MPSSPAAPPGRRGSVVDLGVWAVVALVWSLVGVHLHDNFGTGMDLAIFDQAVGNLSRLQAPTSSMKMVGMNLWGDHFHPLLVLAAPFYWIWDDPRMLLVLQGLCVGFGAAVLSRVARRTFDGVWVGCLVALAFAFGRGAQAAAVFDFHEIALGVPLLALAMAAMIAERWRAAMLWILALLLVKEDSPVLVAGFALAMATLRRWREAAVLLVAAVGWLVVTTKVIIPAMSPTGAWPYASTVKGPAEMFANLWHAMVWPGHLMVTSLLMIAISGLLAVRSPLFWPFLAAIGSRAITDNPSYMGFANHYNLLPALVLGFATVDGWRRLRTRRDLWRRVVVAVLALGLAVNLLWGPMRGQLASVPAERRAAAQAALDSVPAGARVAADVYLVSHLTGSHEVVQKMWPPRFTDDFGHPVLDHVDWVILDQKTSSYRTEQPGWAPREVAELAGHGWRIAHVHGDFVVLEKQR